jgi:hypothetical protein
MEIFGGFMVMLSIIGFFLTVLWFILPFVIFAMKGKLDRACELLENLDRRLAALEERHTVSGTPLAEPSAEVDVTDIPPDGPPPPSAGD